MLITVLLVMLALLGLGVLALWMTSGNLQISANANLRNQALYVAEAGIEAVRNDLNANPTRPIAALLAGGKDLINDNVPTGVDADGQPNGIGAVYYFLDNTTTTNVAFPPDSFLRGLGGSGVQSTTMGTLHGLDPQRHRRATPGQDHRRPQQHRGGPLARHRARRPHPGGAGGDHGRGRHARLQGLPARGRHRAGAVQLGQERLRREQLGPGRNRRPVAERPP